jgi:hypothetical protein
MNKKNSNQYTMFLTTQGYLDEHTTIWNTIPRVVSYKSDFDELVSRISAQAEAAEGGVGVTARKEQLRKALETKLVGISGAAQAYANEKGDSDLLQKVSINQSDFRKLKEAEIDPYVKSFMTVVRGLLPELADFGVSEAQLAETETTLDELSTLLGKPRVLLSNKFAALQTLDELIQEASQLLNRQMDNIMLMFKGTHPEFYDGYQRSRVIVDR